MGGMNISSECRLELARLFSVPNPEHIALSSGATSSLNQVIQGLLSEQTNAHVLATRLEHNSVIRPLEHLRLAGKISVEYLIPDLDGVVSDDCIFDAIKADTRLICVTHASNVTGNIQPVERIASVAERSGIPLLIDASQTAGAVNLCYNKLPGRVFVVFAGHKGLFGPAGTGGMILPDDKLPQTVFGGTGIRSELLLHPTELPLRHECGTANLPGISGLTEGVRFVLERGVEVLGNHRKLLVDYLRNELKKIHGVRLSPLAGNDGRAGIVAFCLDGWSPEESGMILRDAFRIETRDGLHCAPLTNPCPGFQTSGSTRVSFSHFNTRENVEALVKAVLSITESCH